MDVVIYSNAWDTWPNAELGITKNMAQLVADTLTRGEEWYVSSVKVIDRDSGKIVATWIEYEDESA
jgi:hypothetical protein